MLFLFISLLAGIDEPRVPRDPHVVRDAQNRLTLAWRACSFEIYPKDPVEGVDKVSTSVTFFEKSASLRMSFHTIDGTELPQSELQRAFVTCVKTEFEKATLGPHDQNGKSWGITNPAWEMRVVEQGKIGRAASTFYIYEHLVNAKRGCNEQRHVTITIDVKPDGTVDKIVATPQSDCVRALLEKRLRFPVLSTPSQLVSAD
jgi:hypothetical protein